MYDLASTLESYTIPEYEIATEGLVGGVIKVILAFLKSFKGRLLAIVSAIVAILVASKKKGNSNNNSEPPEKGPEPEPPKKSTGYNYKRRPNATIARNNPQEPQQQEEPSSSVNSRYNPDPKIKSAERGTRDEHRERERIMANEKKLEKKLQNIIRRVLNNIDKGINGTKLALDTLVENINKPGSSDIDNILVDCAISIGGACESIENNFEDYDDYKLSELKNKISIDTAIYKKLAEQKSHLQSMIKTLDDLIGKYIKAERFSTNEGSIPRVFIKKIPNRAAELVAHITKALTIIKLHTA